MERIGSLIDFTRTLISFNKLVKVRKGGKEGDTEKITLIPRCVQITLKVRHLTLAIAPFLLSSLIPSLLRWKSVESRAARSRWA